MTLRKLVDLLLVQYLDLPVLCTHEDHILVHADTVNGQTGLRRLDGEWFRFHFWYLLGKFYYGLLQFLAHCFHNLNWLCVLFFI